MKTVLFVNIPGTGKTMLAVAFYYYYKYGSGADKIDYLSLWPPITEILFDEILDNLRRGIPPTATEVDKPEKLKFEIKIGGISYSFTFYSLSGEIIKEFARNRNEKEIRRLLRTNRHIREFANKLLHKSSVLVITFDPTLREAREILQSRCLCNTLLTVYAKESRSLLRRKEKIGKPVIVAITKCDLVNIEDPEQFLKKKDPLLYGVIRNRFKNYYFIKTSAYGKARRIDSNEYVPEEGTMKPIGMDKLLELIINISS